MQMAHETIYIQFNIPWSNIFTDRSASIGAQKCGDLQSCKGCMGTRPPHATPGCNVLCERCNSWTASIYCRRSSSCLAARACPGQDLPKLAKPAFHPHPPCCCCSCCCSKHPLCDGIFSVFPLAERAAHTRLHTCNYHVFIKDDGN